MSHRAFLGAIFGALVFLVWRWVRRNGTWIKKLNDGKPEPKP
jgi:hypothetical protein